MWRFSSGSSSTEARVKPRSMNQWVVRVVSTNGSVKIIAAMRVIQQVGGVQTSYSEIAGLPASRLSTGYWFPWYNNVNFDTQLRIAVP